MTLPAREEFFRHFRPLYAVLLVLITGWWIALQFMPMHDTSWNYLFNVAYGLPWFLAGVGFFWVAWTWRRERYADTPAVVLLGIAYLLSGIAQGVWTWYNFSGVEVPEFTLADVFFISSVLLDIAALSAFLFHRLKTRKMSRPIVTILVATTVLAGFLASWWVLRSLITSTGVLTLDTFYSMTSILILFLALLNVNRERHGELQAFFYLLFFSAIVSVVGDFAFALRNNIGTYWNGDVTDGLYAASALIVLYAVGRTLPRRIAHDGEGNIGEGWYQKLHLLLPIGIMLIGVVVAARLAVGAYASFVSLQLPATDAYSIALVLFLIIMLIVCAMAVIVYLLASQRTRLQDELQKKTYSLRKTLEELKTAERSKTQFVFMVAHQLRAPMTHLRWLLEEMQADKTTPAGTRRQLARMEKVMIEESAFVGDLLNVSRIERGVLRIDRKPALLSDLIKRAVEPMATLAHDRHTSIRVGKLPRVSVDVDREKCVQALRNVIDNAIKYTPEGNVVSVTAVVEGNKACVSITDQGPGIPKAFQDKLFVIKTELTTNAAGSDSAGLGLFLTKKFVDAMGGSVTFDTGPKGTTFHVRLPVA